MFGLGSEELVLILVIILVLFGGKKLPELSRSIGQSMRELRNGFKDDDSQDTKTKPAESSKKS